MSRPDGAPAKARQHQEGGTVGCCAVRELRLRLRPQQDMSQGLNFGLESVIMASCGVCNQTCTMAHVTKLFVRGAGG